MSIWNSPSLWENLFSEHSLFRGHRCRNSSEVLTLHSPSARLPVHTPPAVQVEIDNWFENRFGIRFRQRSLFSTGSLEVARSYAGDYGEVRVLRPAADFCFCWSPVCEDLYAEYENLRYGESIPMLLDRLQFRCDDLQSAILSKNEIMLVCSSVRATRPINS